jgi:hypothetical protein
VAVSQPRVSERCDEWDVRLELLQLGSHLYSVRIPSSFFGKMLFMRPSLQWSLLAQPDDVVSVQMFEAQLVPALNAHLAAPLQSVPNNSATYIEPDP